MAVEHQVGATADVRVVIVAVNAATSEANVRVVDDNGTPITAAVTLPMALVRVTGVPVAVGDVLEEITTGRTAVVRWVDPTSPIRWSPAASGTPTLSSTAWKKIGTFPLP